MIPPNRYSQYENAFRRGNATSGEPICSGRMKFANPNRIGVAYSSSMIVPCMVNSWLNCSFDRYCRPGRASSPRISSAIRPPIMKNANDVVRYMIPICLGSVVLNSERKYEPFGRARAAPGWGTTGVGLIVVITASRLLHCVQSLGEEHRPPGQTAGQSMTSTAPVTGTTVEPAVIPLTCTE